MTLMIAVLAINLHLSTLFSGGHVPASTPTCHITTVSYKFVGTPGSSFSYAGSTYTVPATGSIELIAASKNPVYTVADKQLPLDVWPADDFGTRTVPLPGSNRPALDNASPNSTSSVSTQADAR